LTENRFIYVIYRICYAIFVQIKIFKFQLHFYANLNLCLIKQPCRKKQVLEVKSGKISMLLQKVFFNFQAFYFDDEGTFDLLPYYLVPHQINFSSSIAADLFQSVVLFLETINFAKHRCQVERSHCKLLLLTSLPVE